MIFKKIVISVFLVASLLSCFSQTNGEETVFLRSTRLEIRSEDAELFEKCGLPSRKAAKLSLLDYDKVAENVLQYLENHGYPFANVSLQTVMNADSTFSYYLNVDKNRYVQIDSIVVKGNARIRQSFLRPYLGFKKNTQYSEKEIGAIGKKIASLPFVTEVQPSGISFVEDRTLLYIYIDRRKTNRFDGYIGFQPVSSSSGRLSVTGEVSLALQNMMRVGETISLLWRSSERHSQYLSVDAAFPCLFYTRFGVDAAFELDKHDTSYLTLDFNVGIPYRFRNDCEIRPFFTYSKSQTLGAKPLESLAYTDFRKTLYGISARYTAIDYMLNPRKGVDVSFEAAAGVRTSTSNDILQNVPSSVGRQTSFTLQGEAAGYIPFAKHFTIALRVRSGSLFGGVHYVNEMFRIGGRDFVRGFTNNELLASTYLMASGELRYLFGSNSNVHIFFDGGVYERNCAGDYLYDTPFGFGLGVDIGVKSGVFYFEYALPRQRGNNISFKTGKIHFGVKAVF